MPNPYSQNSGSPALVRKQIPGDAVQVADSVSVEWDLWFCIPDELPSDAVAGDPPGTLSMTRLKASGSQTILISESPEGLFKTQIAKFHVQGFLIQ